MEDVTNIEINFTQEKQLNERYLGAISNFWDTGTFDFFTGTNQCKIAYATFLNTESSSCLVIVPGRAESYLKYQELCFDMFQYGYSVFILDHRGQGLSDRLIKDKQKGYVDSFEFYINDLHTFIKSHVQPYTDELKKPYLLAHSMGGLIAARLMQKSPDIIQAAALSSPMIGVDTGIIPFSVAKYLIKLSAWTNVLLSNEPWYFASQTPFYVKPLLNNPLTHSAVRYQKFIQLSMDRSEIQLGGVTTHWLNESIKARFTLLNHMGQLCTPILVLQGSKDTVVSPKAQNRFCSYLHHSNSDLYPYASPVIINGALHELLFEQDTYRNEALAKIIDWFEMH